MIYELDDRKPVLEGDNFVAPNAAVIGSVVMEKGASVWWSVHDPRRQRRSSRSART